MNPTVLDRLLAIGGLLQRTVQRSFTGASLTESRLQVLWVLFHTGPSTQKVLATAMGITPRSVSALVDGLEAAGYVERVAHPDDRRAVHVTLTNIAVTTMWRLQEHNVKLSSELMAAVDPADRDAFERGLNAVFSRIDEVVRRG